MATPTVRKLQLGNELRRVRESAGHTPAEAAEALDCNVTKISRLELGQSAMGLGDLKLLLDFYGTEPGHAERMIELSRSNRTRGRWTGYRAAFPQWFRMYVDLEHDAEDIRLTEVELVPGILQTESYMRALYESAPPLLGAVSDVDEAVRSRTSRQAVLDRAEPPTLSFVLSESCVRRRVGGAAVMAEQLGYLLEVAGRPNAQLQIRAFDAESGGGFGPFSLLRVPSPGDAPPLEFVYLEDYDDARYLDDTQAVRRYNTLWGAVQASALAPAATRSMLRALVAQLTEGRGDDRR